MSLSGPPGGKDVLELDAIGVGKEDRVIAGRVLRILGRSIQDGDAKIEKCFVQRIDCEARRGSEGKMVKPRRVAVVMRGCTGGLETDLDMGSCPDGSLEGVCAATKPDQRKHLVIEGCRTTQVADRDIDVMDCSAGLHVRTLRSAYGHPDRRGAQLHARREGSPEITTEDNGAS